MVRLQRGVRHWLCEHCRFDLDCKTFDCSQNKFKANADLTPIMPQGSTRQWGLSFTLTRKIIFLRDKGICQQCKHPIVGEYHVHHLKHREHKGSDHPSNLILLCPKCHAAMNSSRMEKILEAEREKTRADGFWKKFTAPVYSNSTEWTCSICGMVRIGAQAPKTCSHDFEAEALKLLEGLA